MIYLHHATIFTPHHQLENGALLIDGDQFVEVGTVGQVSYPSTAQIIDATGMFVVPGFIDLQCNGGFGYDFTADPTTIWSVAARLPQYGVTAFLPTIITSPLTTITRAQETLIAGPPSDQAGAYPLGLHVEGPFLNPAKKGAHNPAYLRQPALADIRDWSAEGGIRLVTLAPELPGALALVDTLTKRGVVVSAGHSLATFAEAQAGFAAGITYGTHLFNAMPPLHHREPGLVGALLAEAKVKVGLIADGVHVHPSLVQLVWQVVGPERLTLVTDAMAALGMPVGRYQLGEFAVTVDEQTARLADDTLAGSILTTDVALRNLIVFAGCSLHEALPALTSTPAALLGLESNKGRLAAGYDADLLVLTPDLQVALTIVGGEIVYQT
jgi:N-acetylglucosamine-6-phosphate deacetylase